MIYTEHNGSGYVDPTVDAVIKREQERKERVIEDREYHTMVNEIKKLLGKHNYELCGPISLINMDTNRKRRIY